jgi:16S rRNA (adenine1518-N6/adenine1519-N6)-dimethyltransferase
MEAWARPNKRLGQHFLHDQGVRRRIVDALDPVPGDRVLEIGPGRGALTAFIAEASPEVFVALEKDPDLAFRLKAQWPGLDVVVCDALKFVWERLDGARAWKLIGNLPYNVASPIMWEVFSRTPSLERAVFMVQKEVGRRLTARHGTKDYGALTVWVANFVSARRLFDVGAGAFTPPPRVDSMVLAFEPGERSEFDDRALSALLRLCFQKRRKQLGTILGPRLGGELDTWLAKQGLDRRVRPENLTPEQFKSLATHAKSAFVP